MPNLLRVEKPIRDENIYSYINRLTESNKYESNTWILNKVNITRFFGPRNLLPWNFDFQPLINETGIGIEELSKLTLHKEFGYEKENFKHFNYLLYKEMLMGVNCKVCPKCLDEYGINYKLWDIRIFLICPVHKCLLISKCPNCEREIPQYRKDFYKCSCNHDIRNILTNKITDSISMFLPNLIYKKFYSDNYYSEEGNTNPLYNLEMKYILLIYIFFIKLFYRDKTRIGSTAIPYDPLNSEYFHLINKVSSIFNSWPNGFYDFLNEYLSSSKSKPKYDRGSLINNFDYFYIDLYKKYSHPNLKFLTDEFEQYIYETWDKTIVSHGKFFKKDPLTAKYLSTTNVAKLLNIQHKHVRKLISTGHLEAKVTSERSSYFLVLRESVEEYIENNKFYMNREEIKEFLNIGYQSIIELEKRGIIKLESGRDLDGNVQHLYEKTSVQRIIEVIASRFLDQEDKNPDKTADIVRCTKYVVGTTIADILDLIIEGRVLPVSINKTEKGLRKYLLSVENVKQEAFEYKIRRETGVLSLQEIMKYLGIGKNLLLKLIDNKFLKPTEYMEKPFIPVEDVVKFKNEYITLGQLSLICKESCQDLIEKLNNKQVSPVLDHFIKKFLVYRIKDVKWLIINL